MTVRTETAASGGHSSADAPIFDSAAVRKRGTNRLVLQADEETTHLLVEVVDENATLDGVVGRLAALHYA